MRVADLSCASFALASLSLSWTSLQQLLLQPPTHSFNPSTLTALFCDHNTTEPEYPGPGDLPQTSFPIVSHAAICTSLRRQLDQTYSAGQGDGARRTVHFTAVSEDSHQFSRRSVLYWSEVCGLSSMLSSIHLTTAPYSEHGGHVDAADRSTDGSSCVSAGAQGGENGGDGKHSAKLRQCEHVCNVRTVHLASGVAGQGLRDRNNINSSHGNSDRVLDMYCVEDFFTAARENGHVHQHPQSRPQPEQQHLHPAADVQWVYVPSLLLWRNHTRHHGLSQRHLASLYYELQHVLWAARNAGVSLRIEFLSAEAQEEVEEEEGEVIRVDGATSSVDPSQLSPYTAPANLHSSRRNLGFQYRSWLFVYIVVYDFHESAARDFVELMRLHCLKSDCEECVYFVIVTVDSSLDRRALSVRRRYEEYASLCIHGASQRSATSTSPVEQCEGGSRIVPEYLACVPSPITALQELSAHMKDSTTADDTVYFLPGLHALYSFPHPGLNLFVDAQRCQLKAFHSTTRGPYSLPYYVWPDGACKYEKVLRLWNMSGEFKVHANLPSAVVLSSSYSSSNNISASIPDSNGTAATIGRAYMGQAESVLAYSDLLLRCTSARLRHGACPAGSAGDSREEEREWGACEECGRWLYAKLQREANGSYISTDRQAIFVPQEASLLLGLVSKQLRLPSAGGAEWLAEDWEMPTSQFILHFFANQVLGVLRGRVHPAHASFVRPRSGTAEDVSKKAKVASLLRGSRWLRGYDVRLEYVNGTIMDTLENFLQDSFGSNADICNQEINPDMAFLLFTPDNQPLAGFTHQKYTVFLYYAYLLDFVSENCSSSLVLSLLGRLVAYHFYEAMRVAPFLFPALGEAAAILSLLDHLRSTMLLEITDANLHYSVNALVPYFAHLISNHYAARRAFAYSVWRDGRVTMQLSEVQRRRARMAQSYAFPPEKVRVHYATYASNATHEGVQWLLKTASIAGVRVQVLGQGEAYVGHGRKVSMYHDFVSSRGLSEEDVVVLVDGYDVLLFPPVRRLLSTMRSLTSKPIVLCADGGMYPELQSPHFYRHPAGSGASRSSLPLHFVNSGVIIGKVWALRLFFAWAAQFADTVLCDQSLLNRHVLMVPDLYHIDSEQVLSSAGYKNHVLLNALDTDNLYITDMSLKVKLLRATSIGHDSVGMSKDVLIFHANVIKSNRLYDATLTAYSENFKRNILVDGEVDVARVYGIWNQF